MWYTPLALPRHSVPLALSGSSFPPAPPLSSVAPAPPRPSGSPPPPRSPELSAPPWPFGSSVSPWLSVCSAPPPVAPSPSVVPRVWLRPYPPWLLLPSTPPWGLVLAGIFINLSSSHPPFPHGLFLKLFLFLPLSRSRTPALPPQLDSIRRPEGVICYMSVVFCLCLSPVTKFSPVCLFSHSVHLVSC